jgi:hypothetical protein
MFVANPALVVWSILTMLHSALRLAAPAFTLGLAFAIWQSTPRVAKVTSAEEAGADPPGGSARALTETT